VIGSVQVLGLLQKKMMLLCHQTNTRQLFTHHLLIKGHLLVMVWVTEEEKEKEDVVCAAVIIQQTRRQLDWLLLRHLFPMSPQHLRH
jgi:hypothetical protein